MGLDVVEMLIAVETAFEVRFEDREIQQIYTVGDLHRLVKAKLADRPIESSEVACANVPAFDRLRRALIDVRGVSRSAVRPATAVETLVPLAGRREAWRAMSRQSGLRLPSLVAPRWVLALGFAVASAICLAGCFFYSLQWSLILLFFAAFFSVLQVTTPLHQDLPDGIATVGDLSRSVAAWNYTVLSRGRSYVSSDEVWNALVEVIAEPGVERSTIQPNASFTHDLKLD